MTERQQKLMFSISECVYSSSHLESLMTTTVEEVKKFLQADRVMVYSFGTDDKGVMLAESLAPGTASLLGRDITVNGYGTSSISYYQQGTVEAIDNSNISDCDLDQISSLNVLGVKASLVLPIVVNVESLQSADEDKLNSSMQNSLWGLLIVHYCHHHHEWLASEIETLKFVRLQLATAIKQRLLFEQVQQEIVYRQVVEAREKQTVQQLETALLELQQAQEELIQNEKMAVIGTKIAEIANEIVHPANFIYSNLIPASQYAEDFIRLIELYQHFYPDPPDAIVSQIEHLELDFIKTDLLKVIVVNACWFRTNSADSQRFTKLLSIR
ncbi:MAG: GAF domain-containing protein [Calothrix sp. SM1_7_51]|nr:GAF domain-containing protein [Calothrix sp. SM1_7_51]